MSLTVNLIASLYYYIIIIALFNDYVNIKVIDIQFEKLYNFYKKGGAKNEKYKSRYEKEHQKAHPGYYSVVLSDFGVEVELTATQRTAMHRYTFRKAEPTHILVDLQSGIVSKNEQLRTHVIDAEVQLLDQYSIVGKNKVKMWVEREFFYVIKFDKPYIAIEELQPQEGEKAKRLLLSFDLKPGENIQVKVGLSTVSIEGAQEALEKEKQTIESAIASVKEEIQTAQKQVENFVKDANAKEETVKELELKKNTAQIKYEQAVSVKEQKEKEYRAIANDGKEIENHKRCETSVPQLKRTLVSHLIFTPQSRPTPTNAWTFRPVRR